MTARFADAAAAVLRQNDLGHLTVASPRLYPHQWSWDTAFIAVGISRLSVPRAVAEMRSLLAAQWPSGMIPHIVFDRPSGYFPGPERWRSEVALDPPALRTSGICQPPVHSVALACILREGRRRGGSDRRAAEEFVADTLPAWLAWHRWLAASRDPDGTGLVEIHHSWESGMDNSPRWDLPYSRISPGPMEPFTRTDTRHVGDAGQRPTDAEYRRYIWLVDQMVAARYDEESIRKTIDFKVADVFFSALLALGAEIIGELAEEFGRPSDAAEMRCVAARFRAGVASTVSPETGLARDRDLRGDGWLATATLCGFAPLISGADPDVMARQRELLLGPDWCGHEGLRHAVPPSTSPAAEQFDARRYWRGPQWPVMTWLFSWAARRHGDTELAGGLREESLRQLGDLTFAEYYDPMTGQALGSSAQSWTAAAALDWTAWS
ncbi:glycoside hydrolase 100 family protein [Spongiactinospora sp. TRM90649]|uniref:glucosylglycerate hydrolase n=1 Tax=Spongiactinospora sp. TRM90649 TaxID=3031114 RepID=UPI0023F9699F|nr:glycoside hydrolase 100 family protein [Spongiactinospora sp. TRM90649]MDF5758329.1 glycoside hydrolase 100 family protein [Spongiactinospora sp. TRM90649]